MAKMGRPKSDNPKDYHISARIEPDTYAKLVQYAKDHDMTVGEAIRKSVNNLLRRRTNGKTE